MNPIPKFLAASILLIGLAFGMSSCVTDGYVAGGTGGYYGSGYGYGPGYGYDQPWVYGRPRAFVDVDVHPVRREEHREQRVERRDDRGDERHR